eukprot:TRINITY_DN8081_c0_g1_i1.p1 TRINITY_DN8081_c0_g1~~TRINITY_DN8081_c0_g1_i1.p1  ORF type:complete len:1342 (-),score=239.50 TRINITY_DN8081_c0_g1_i1:53-3901(-)
MELYMKHKQERELLGELAQQTEYTALKNSFASQSLRVDPIPAARPLFGLEVVGHGINWWDGSFTPQPLIDLGSNLKNTYFLPSSNELFNIPDEYLITNTPLISRDGEVSYQENYNEFASMRSNKFGFGIGFGGFMPLQGSIENGRVQAVYRKETIRTAQVDIRALFYSVNLLPPSFLKLKQNIRDTFSALPRFDAGTRLIWFNTLAKLGSHIVIGADLGGTAHMDSVIDTVEFGSRGASWTQTQLTLQFASFTSPDLGKRQEASQNLDPLFSNNANSNFAYQGGNTSLPSYDQNAWLESLPSNLVPLRFRTLPIADFFAEGTRLHDDLKTATQEFLVFSAPMRLEALFLGDEVEVGTSGTGASVWSSSYRTEDRRECHSCWLFFKCCKTVTDSYNNVADLIREGGSAFVFNRNDGDQRASVTLNTARYVIRQSAEVSPPGSGRPTTQATISGSASDAWGPGNKPVTASMSIKSVWPAKISQVTYAFGPAPPGTGSSINRLRVWAIEQSAPVGGVDSMNRFQVNGWAFDPIDPGAALIINVFVDGSLHASGTTGLAHDAAARYKLPSGAKPGFSVALNINKDAMRLHNVYVTWQGITQVGRSGTVSLWSMQPPGRLLLAEPSRVQGWAYIHDQPSASYSIEISVDGQKVASGTTGNIDSAIVRSVFNADGNYGFQIPLQIKTAGQHQVTATLVAPDGTRLQFEDTLSVDLRFPVGEIFDVAPGWVAGFAYDPNTPNQPSRVQVFVDGALVATGLTTKVLPDYNARYLIEGAHGFNISLRMQGGKLHMVQVYASVGVGLKLIGEKSIGVGLADQGTSKVTNGIINFAGAGFNPCYGEWRLRVVDLNYKDKKVIRDAAFKETNLYDLGIPDEYDFSRSSEQIYTNTTNIYRDIKEWAHQQMHSWKVGFSLGFFGFSTSYQKVTLEKHFTDVTSRVSHAQRMITLFEMKAAPPELLSFTSYAGYELMRLPPYNAITRPQWFRFFDLFGLTYAKSLKLGGRMDFMALYKTTNTSYARYEYEREQAGFVFTFYITLSASFEHAQSEAAVDRAFMRSLTQSVRFIGGRPEKFNIDESEAWMRTIRENPTIVDMELESISELLWKPDQQERKKWFDAASADYLRTCTPESWVCRRYNSASYADGARIVGASSQQSGQPQSSISNIISDKTTKVPWNGDVAFQFADGDRKQYLVLDLGFILDIKAIAVDLDAYPSETGVWEYITVEVSTNQQQWALWASVGSEGHVSITKTHYDFPLLVTEKVRYIRFSFGGVRDNKRGTKIGALYAYSCA